jgi:hypothetical protein
VSANFHSSHSSGEVAGLWRGAFAASLLVAVFVSRAIAESAQTSPITSATIAEDRAFLESAERAVSPDPVEVERAAVNATVSVAAAARFDRPRPAGVEHRVEAPPPLATRSVKQRKIQRDPSAPTAAPAPVAERIVEVRRAEVVQPEHRGFFDKLFEKHD